MKWRDLIQRLRSMMTFDLRAPGPLPEPASGVTRRQFLAAVGIAAATIALLPETLTLDAPQLDAPVVGVSIAEWDAMFKEIYAPLIVEELNRTSLILQLMERES